jgi:hypothetical protein
MNSKKFILCIVLFVFIRLLSSDSTFAEGTGSVKLSYKIAESNTSAGTLTMLVKLKVQNTGSTPISGVSAKNIYANNIVITADQINIGNINPGETVTGSDSFTITMNTGSSNQEPPQKEAVWSVEYTDVNGNPVVEEVVLR